MCPSSNSRRRPLATRLVLAVLAMTLACAGEEAAGSKADAESVADSAGDAAGGAVDVLPKSDAADLPQMSGDGEIAGQDGFPSATDTAVSVPDSAVPAGGDADAAAVVADAVPDAASDSASGEIADGFDDAADAAADATPVAVCGDQACDLGGGESPWTCPSDCKDFCGNGACEPGENPGNCKADCCGKCGDGKCLAGACAENNATCPADCTLPCGNKTCEKGENPQSCPEDCKFKACGNAVCEGGEDPASCPGDCGSTCGDCKCEKGESAADCPVDCGSCGDGVCRCAPYGKDDKGDLDKCAADCQQATCKPGQDNPECADANPCTTDSCDPKGGYCVSLAKDGSPCDDSNICTESDLCLQTQCGGTAVVCNDSNPCTLDKCDPKLGCQYDLPIDGTPCNDNNACTDKDLCAGKICAGKAVTCEDGNPCTKNQCQSASGCSFPAEATGTVCDDDSNCTDSDACAGSVCAGVVVNCDDDDPCTKDSCTKAKGCDYSIAVGAPCDDLNACTVGDKCNGKGVCAASQQKICDDANPCTADSCNAQQGCAFDAKVAVGCDDGSVCTTADQCNAGTCVGTAKNCDDTNPCTWDSCDKATGCIAMSKDASPCDDNDACTEGDACLNSACKGAPVNCDDKNPCTKDSCHKTESCKHVITDGASCDDGKSCTEQDACKQAVCEGKELLWILPVVSNASHDDYIDGVAVAPDGTTYSVGHRIEQSQFGTYQEPTIQRTDRFGQVVWSKKFTKDAVSHGNSAVVLVDGGLLVSGYEDAVELPWNSDTGKDVVFRKYSLQGQEAGLTKLTFNKHQVIGQSALLSDGSVGHCGNEEGGKGFYVRTNAGGTVSWSYSVASPSGSGAFAGAAPGDSGSLWCVGVAYGAPDKIWIARFSTTGSVLVNKTLTPQAGVAYLGQRLVLHGANLVVAGQMVSPETGHTRAFVAEVPVASSNFLWSAIVDRDHSNARGIANFGGGNWGLAVSTADDAPIFAVASNAGIAGEVGSSSGGQRFIADAQYVPGIGWTVGGWTGTGKMSDGFVGRMDAFGNIGCAASGECVAKGYSACVDSSPCTVDSCTAGKGCTSGVVADGTPCGGGKLCSKQKCGP